MTKHVSWNTLKIQIEKRQQLPARLRESAELHSETAAIMLEAAKVIEEMREEAKFNLETEAST